MAVMTTERIKRHRTISGAVRVEVEVPTAEDAAGVRRFACRHDRRKGGCDASRCGRGDFHHCQPLVGCRRLPADAPCPSLPEGGPAWLRDWTRLTILNWTFRAGHSGAIGSVDERDFDQAMRVAAKEPRTVAAQVAGGSPHSVEDVQRFGDDPLATFRLNLESVEERIAGACARAGRDRGSVRLLPITKTVPAHILRSAYEAGIHSFGENKVQEALLKHDALAGLAVDWSIVGHLQTNKVKYLTRFAREFHALDSLRVADLLNKCLESEGRSLDVYVQVNTSGEGTKYGLHPDALMPFVDMLFQFPKLKPRGLMTLALFSSDVEKVRPCFQLLRRLRDQVIKRNPALTELSMGMSSDFEEAIVEGADVVRIGQAIFGKRPTPDEHYWPDAGPK